MESIDIGKRYQLITKTNFSIIYKFIDEKDGKPYILKVIPNHSNRKEIEICNSLPYHPNIIRYIGEGDFRKNKYLLKEMNEEYKFLVFEYFEGVSLHKYLKENNKISPIIIKKIFYQILKGVQVLHKNNIIHNDIKLENILINPRKHLVKLIDFGLSQFGKEKVENTIFGSLPYLSPEIVTSKLYSVYSDIWAIGILLFAMIEGRFPFYSNSKEEIMEEISKYNVKETVKKVYNEKYCLNQKRNFMNNMILRLKISDKVENSHNINELKNMIEISLSCLKSTPEKRPLIEEILNYQIFQDILIF